MLFNCLYHELTPFDSFKVKWLSSRIFYEIEDWFQNLQLKFVSWNEIEECLIKKFIHEEKPKPLSKLFKLLGI